MRVRPFKCVCNIAKNRHQLPRRRPVPRREEFGEVIPEEWEYEHEVARGLSECLQERRDVFMFAEDGENASFTPGVVWRYHYRRAS